MGTRVAPAPIRFPRLKNETRLNGSLIRCSLRFLSRSNPMDAVYLGLTAVLFALTLGLIRLCEKV
jgi:hypothetical protein